MENEDQQSPKPQRPVATIVAVIVVLVIIAALAFYLTGRDVEPEPEPTPAPTQPATSTLAEPEPAPEPEPEPVPEPQAEPEPLPPLDQSDQAVLEQAREVAPQPELVNNLVVSDEVLRKFVRAVNAAEDGKLVHEYRPLVSPPPPLAVEKVGEAATEAEQRYRLQEANYERYDPYVRLLARTDPAQVARAYERFLPLLEKAYQEHGVDNGSFHEVLIETIDSLLAAPEPPEEIILVRPKVFYEYADPELETLPDTHKLMLRMGPENSQRIKRSLRQLKAELNKIDPQG